MERDLRAGHVDVPGDGGGGMTACKALVPIRGERVEQKVLPPNPLREPMWAMTEAFRNAGAAFSEVGRAAALAVEAMRLADEPDGPRGIIDVEYREIERDG